MKAWLSRATWRPFCASSFATVAEEIPEAYKDVAEVVEVVHGAGIGRKVVCLRPLGVLKG